MATSITADKLLALADELEEDMVFLQAHGEDHIQLSTKDVEQLVDALRKGWFEINGFINGI